MGSVNLAPHDGKWSLLGQPSLIAIRSVETGHYPDDQKVLCTNVYCIVSKNAVKQSYMFSQLLIVGLVEHLPV